MQKEEPERTFCVMVDRRMEASTVASISQGLAEQAEKQKRTKSFEEIVPTEYHSFRQVFDKDSFDELPPRRTWDHAIELKNNASPRVGKIYPLSLPKSRNSLRCSWTKISEVVE